MEGVTEFPVTQEENISITGNPLHQAISENSKNSAAKMTQEEIQPTNQFICNRLEIVNQSHPLNLERVTYFSNKLT